MIRVFPVVASNYGYASRFGTGPKDHHGTDIFAPRGAPVLAVDHGNARRAVDSKGGNVVYLDAPDGERYYYAHLDSVAVEFGPVAAGEPVGTVGDSGNAKGKQPHLHFQMRDSLGDLRDPYPFLAGIDPKQRGTPTPTPGRPVPGRPTPEQRGAAVGASSLLLVLLIAVALAPKVERVRA